MTAAEVSAVSFSVDAAHERGVLRDGEEDEGEG